MSTRTRTRMDRLLTMPKEVFVCNVHPILHLRLTSIDAMEWTSSVIRMWNFGRGNIPADISSGSPDPSKWGLPAFTTAGGSCNNIDDFFKSHQVTFDTTFCGNWAGQQSIWQQTSCYDPNKYPTCNSYVAANPSVYEDAYWLIKSLKVYQSTPGSTSSSSTSSSTIS